MINQDFIRQSSGLGSGKVKASTIWRFVHIDPQLLVGIILLCAFGLLVLWSASDRNEAVLQRHALFVGGNWHLFWFVFVPVGVLGMYRCMVAPDLRAPMYTVLLSAFLLVFLFVFTEASRWVVSFTIVNRLLLHFVPMGMFVVWLVVHSAARNEASAT